MPIARPLLLLPLLAAGCAQAPHPAAPAAASGPVAVATAIAREVERDAVEALPGTVRPAIGIALMARVPATVRRLAVAPGEAVAAGALLAELEAGEVLARRDQAAAALAAAEAAEASARAGRAEASAGAILAASRRARAHRLFAGAAATEADVDAADAAAAVAEARIAAAEAQIAAAGRATAAARAGLAEAETMAGYLTMTAPFAGVVVRTHAEVGDLLSPGRPLLDLEDPASLRAEVEVPESLAARVAVGASLRVQVPAAGIDREAAVVEVIPAADPASRTVLAKLALPAGAPGLRSGQFLRVAVPVAAGRMLAVPSAALVRRGQLDAVFVVADGAARLRLVRTGAADGGLIAIRAGLAAGEAVVAEGAAGLADGQAVAVR